MAAITRRSWSQLKTEFIRSAKGMNYDEWPARAEQLLYEAYLDICTIFHHPELEAQTPRHLPEGKNAFLMPDDGLISMAVAEVDPSTGEPSLYLDGPLHIGVWSGAFSSIATGQPTQFTQFRRVLFLDRYTDQERQYRVYYLRFPRKPDMDATDEYPEIGEQWDGHLLEKALHKAGRRNGIDALAERNKELFLEFATQQPQPRIVESTVPSRPEVTTTNRPQGGLLT